MHCYELCSCIGGRYASVENEGDTQEPLTHYNRDPQALIYSQFVTSFSDFPLPDDLTPSLFNRGRFLTPAAFREYLDRYVSFFSLRPHIVCRMEVVDVERLKEEEDDFRWSVTVRTRAGERRSKHRFVIIATGSRVAPRMPLVRRWRDRSSFADRVHSIIVSIL